MESTPATPPLYQTVLVPALQKIQHEYGYLHRGALARFSKESGIALPRIHAVASFFPHFQLEPPKKVIVRICRDMACAMAGSREMLRTMQEHAGPNVAIEGVSCLGRCDRPPAACVSIHTAGSEHYHLGKSAADLQQIVDACLADTPSESDSDADAPNPLAQAEIDPYAGEMSTYAGVQKAVAARNDALTKALDLLERQFRWDRGQSDYFWRGCIGEELATAAPNEEVAEAIRCWQTETDWAKDSSLAGWSDAILAELDAGDLRGMGGAGIPSSQKLRDVRNAVQNARGRDGDIRAFIIVNGDESEPATFKDRELLLRTPHLIVEGVILAGLITEATQGFIYIRHEYHEQIEACRAEIRRAERLGFCGMQATVLGRPFPISVFVSPGGYICGEQSALVEAMSDRRGEPRNMPPKLETNGLDDQPTIVSNVETYAWIPYIWIKGGATYAGRGVNGWKGRRIFSISGDVNRPGVYEVPMGMTLRELITDSRYCQGVVDGRALKAIAPSGPSGGFLPAKLTAENGLPRKLAENKGWLALAERRGFSPDARELDVLDLELELNLFRALSPTQALGAGIVVYAEGRDMLAEAVHSMEFFRNESCGKCVPCRTGSQKLSALGNNLLDGKISATEWDETLWPLMQEMGVAVGLASICGLGRSVPVPLQTVVRFFPDDVRKYLIPSHVS